VLVAAAVGVYVTLYLASVSSRDDGVTEPVIMGGAHVAAGTCIK